MKLLNKPDNKSSKNKRLLLIKDKFKQKTLNFYENLVKEKNTANITLVFILSSILLSLIFSLFINNNSPSIVANTFNNLIFLSFVWIMYFLVYQNLSFAVYKIFYDIDYKDFYKILSFNTSIFLLFNFIFILNILISSVMLYSFWIGFSFFAYVLLNIVALKNYYGHSYLFNLLVVGIIPLSIILFIGQLLVIMI
jgi:hypothetical protein